MSHGISNEGPLTGNDHGCCCSSSLPQPGGHQEGRCALTTGPSLDLALSCLPSNAACSRSSASARPLPSPATDILPTGRAAPSAYTSMPSSRTPMDKCMKVNGRTRLQPGSYVERRGVPLPVYRPSGFPPVGNCRIQSRRKATIRKRLQRLSQGSNIY
jgi:hypothetical protein